MNLWENSNIFPFWGVNMPIFLRGYVLLLVLGSVYLQMQSLNLWGSKKVKDVDDKLHIFPRPIGSQETKPSFFRNWGTLDSRAGSSKVLDRKNFPLKDLVHVQSSSSSRLKVDKWD